MHLIKIYVNKTSLPSSLISSGFRHSRGRAISISVWFPILYTTLLHCAGFSLSPPGRSSPVSHSHQDCTCLGCLGGTARNCQPRFRFQEYSSLRRETTSFPPRKSRERFTFSGPLAIGMYIWRANDFIKASRGCDFIFRSSSYFLSFYYLISQTNDPQWKKSRWFCKIAPRSRNDRVISLEFFTRIALS